MAGQMLKEVTCLKNQLSQRKQFFYYFNFGIYQQPFKKLIFNFSFLIILLQGAKSVGKVQRPSCK